jgi:hypothetical protein
MLDTDKFGFLVNNGLFYSFFAARLFVAHLRLGGS